MKKPTSEEWDICINIVEQLANDYTSTSLRRRFFSYMRRLQRKYECNVDIMASIADVYVYNKPAICILKQAYLIAEQNNDYKNMTLIASSISTRYLYRDKVDYCNGRFWTKKLIQNLRLYKDKDTKDTLKLNLKILNDMKKSRIKRYHV